MGSTPTIPTPPPAPTVATANRCNRELREKTISWCVQHDNLYSDCYVGILSAELATLKAENAALRDLLSGVMDSQESNGHVGVKLMEEISATLNSQEGK